MGNSGLTIFDDCHSKEMVKMFRLQVEGMAIIMAIVTSNFVVAQVAEKIKFEITPSRSIDSPPSIRVHFGNGLKDDLDLSHYKLNDAAAPGCNYHGHLHSDPSSSSVAVTGCINKPGDIVDVTLISKNNANQMFSVDFYGNAKVIENPFKNGVVSQVVPIDRNDGWHQVGDEMVNDAEEAAAENAESVPIPSKLKAVIKFGYEETMKRALGDETFDSYITKVLAHAQIYYRLADSLGTVIEFEVQGDAIFEDGASWTAEYNLEDASSATYALGLDGVDTMSWWCDKDKDWGTEGIAWEGGLCSSSGWNTNLNEKQDSVAASGLLLAHELGHNFRMDHDFGEKHGGSGDPCAWDDDVSTCSDCDGKGIMSYGDDRLKEWSSCSKSDWESHYASKDWGNGCLEDISDTGTDTETSTGLQNKGKECWWVCGRREGECSWCGDGMCCRKGWTGNGCDGTIGGRRNHQCVAKPEENDDLETFDWDWAGWDFVATDVNKQPL